MVDSLDKLKHSYRQALQASNYRIIYGTNTVIPYSETMGKEMEEHHYPDSVEKLLMDALKLGDVHKLNLATDDFIIALGRFSYNQIMLSLVQLVVMTLRTAKGMIPTNNDELHTNYDNVYKELQQWDTLEEIKKWYLALCNNIIQIRYEKSNKKNEDLIKKVVQYITEHYHDPNISNEILAHLVGLSPNYLRKIFKEETQQTMTHFIAEMRFQKAKELLLTTNYPANKIGELVGIPNNGYFYIAFKKYYGNIPNHFRAEYKIHDGRSRITRLTRRVIATCFDPDIAEAAFSFPSESHPIRGSAAPRFTCRASLSKSFTNPLEALWINSLYTELALTLAISTLTGSGLKVKFLMKRKSRGFPVFSKYLKYGLIDSSISARTRIIAGFHVNLVAGKIVIADRNILIVPYALQSFPSTPYSNKSWLALSRKIQSRNIMLLTICLDVDGMATELEARSSFPPHCLSPFLAQARKAKNSSSP